MFGDCLLRPGMPHVTLLGSVQLVCQHSVACYSTDAEIGAPARRGKDPNEDVYPKLAQNFDRLAAFGRHCSDT